MDLQNRNRPRPFTAMKTIQRFFFMYPPEGESFSNALLLKHVIPILIFVSPIIMGIHGHAYHAFSDGMVAEAIQSLYSLSILDMVIVLGFTYMYFGDKLWAAIHRIESDAFGMPTELLDEYRRFNMWTWIVYLGVLFADGFISIFYYKVNMFCKVREMLNDSRYRCGFHSAVWYPFEEGEFINEWVLLLWFDISEFVGLPIYLATVFFMIGALKFVPIRLKHLRGQVEALGEKNVQESFEDLEYIVKYYMEIYECTEDFNNSLGYCLVFGYTFSTVIISMTGYVVLLEHRYLELPVLVCSYLFICILCHFGQCWEDEHEKLVQSVCNLPWYQMSPKMRKNYSLLLGTVKSPIHVIGQPFVRINYDLLLTITRTAYSVLTFVSNSAY